MTGAIVAEFRKIRSTRLWWILLICVVLLGGGSYATASWYLARQSTTAANVPVVTPTSQPAPTPFVAPQSAPAAAPRLGTISAARRSWSATRWARGRRYGRPPSGPTSWRGSA